MAKIQLLHPGSQCNYNHKSNSRDYFHDQNIRLYRDWNSGSHYRKFMKSKGNYVDPNNLSKEIKNVDLFYWGEWEPWSYFTPYNNFIDYKYPNGIHEPFYDSYLPTGCQNTDPYIFGDEFKYSNCKQKNILKILKKDDIILFGSCNMDKYPNIFFVDTIFVVSEYYENAEIVFHNNAINYSDKYQKVTINKLGQIYNGPNYSNNKIYKGEMYSKNKDYFSFVPCKTDQDLKSFDYEKSNISGFGRLELDCANYNLSTNNTGIKTKDIAPKMSDKEFWNAIKNDCEKQKFKLGTWFQEPK